MTHPTKPLAAILYFGELGEKFNAQRKNIFGASKLGRKTTFKRYPFLKLRRVFHPTLHFCFKENISKFENSIAGMFSVLVLHRQRISNFETYSGKTSKRNLLVIPQTFKVKKEILENVGIFDLGFSKVFLLLCFSLLMPNLPHQNFG